VQRIATALLSASQGKQLGSCRAVAGSIQGRWVRWPIIAVLVGSSGNFVGLHSPGARVATLHTPGQLHGVHESIGVETEPTGSPRRALGAVFPWGPCHDILAHLRRLHD
jgi:hypothetical protein